MGKLVEAFDDIADHYYADSRDWNIVVAALQNYEKICAELRKEELPQHSIQVIRNITGITCQD